MGIEALRRAGTSLNAFGAALKGVGTSAFLEPDPKECTVPLDGIAAEPEITIAVDTSGSMSDEELDITAASLAPFTKPEPGEFEEGDLVTPVDLDFALAGVEGGKTYKVSCLDTDETFQIVPDGWWYSVEDFVKAKGTV